MTPIENPLRDDLEQVIERTAHLWTELRRRSVFVTGGTGFVGRWMLESLLWANDRLALRAKVVVLSRRPGAFAAAAPHVAAHPAVTLVRGDVGSFAFPDGRYSHVLHLAKEPSLSPAASGAAGTERVLAFAAAHAAAKLLFTSSGAVYGRQPPDCAHLAEDYAGLIAADDPHAAYARGKRAAEAACLAATAASDVSVKIARGFTFVGPFMAFDAGYAAGNLIRDAVAGGPVEVTGDGTPLRSYLYAADLAVWLWTILFAGEAALPYNVGSPDAIAIGDLARLVARTVGGGAAVHIAESPPADPTPPARYVPDVTRAATGLGLTVATGLEDALRRTAGWYRSARGSA